MNGTLNKVIINNQILEKGEITELHGKKIVPIKISKEEIYFGKWRRWIVKSELETKRKNITDKEIEEYLNNEDLIKLYLAGKFKDTLIIFLSIIIAGVVIFGIIQIYLTTTHECIISQDNSTKAFLMNTFNQALQTALNSTGV
jgi:hypothetical protein